MSVRVRSATKNSVWFFMKLAMRRPMVMTAVRMLKGKGKANSATARQLIVGLSGLYPDGQVLWHTLLRM